ncbi:hypothetical protein EG329_009076 [Mollisiaceae sp. DMI_Dod_QoI]|nr:hypothetical protein EG329_009076 [Helotiales sp. DMI_Dod_QoI]
MAFTLFIAFLLLTNFAFLISASTIPARSLTGIGDLVASTNNLGSENIQRRDTPYQHFCFPIAGQDWKPAWRQDVLNALGTLANSTTPCNVDVNQCMRFSCYGHGGIWLCNDSPASLTLNCGVVSSAAADIATLCPPSPEQTNVCGQIFYQEGYNVYVKDDDCDSSASYYGRR